MYCCLTIAGSDSGGGAGLQADLKVFHAIKCFGTSVVTNLTAQNTQSVQSIFPVSPEFVAQQLDSVLSDIQIHAVKIGMLKDRKIIQIVANKLKFYKPLHNFKIVLDPVMVSKSGTSLLSSNAVQCLVDELFPIIDICTPNIPEAQVFLNKTIASKNEMLNSANSLIKMGLNCVLIKGGHLQNCNQASDILLLNENEKLKENWFDSPRINTKNTHGTGCTLSAAITSFLAQQKDMLNAVTLAKSFLNEALIHGQRLELGHGQGPALFV